MDQSSLNIFIINSDKNASLKIESILINSGYKVSGKIITYKKNIKRIKKSLTDLVIIDNNLSSDESGIDIAYDIKNRHNLPVIILLEKPDINILKKVKKANIFGYILKPVNKEKLVAAIEIVYNKFIYIKKIKESEQRYHGIVENLPLMLCRFLPGSWIITYINENYCRYFNKKSKHLIGKNFFEMIPEYELKDLKKRFSLLNKKKPIQTFEHCEETVNGPKWQRRIDQAIFDDYGNIIEYQLIAEDITERKLNEIEIQKTTDQLEERVKELNCLYRISAIAEDMENSMEDIFLKILSIIPGSMQYPDMTCAKIKYKNRIYTTDKFRKSSLYLKNDITIQDINSGYLQICYKNSGKGSPEFLKEECMLATEITERLGKIIERHVVQNELRNLQKEIINISEKERQRIGHEIHDGLGQLLTGISFIFRTVKKKILGSSVGKLKELDELSYRIKEASILCRQISKELPVINIEHDGFLLAIDRLSNELMEVYNVNCIVNIKGKIKLKDNFTASQIFRIIQESVNNAIKHGEADNIFLSIIPEKYSLNIKIRDDGRGMKNKKTGSGMGISIMKYRADLIGAEFCTKNNKKGGFEVSIKILNS